MKIISIILFSILVLVVGFILIREFIYLWKDINK